MIQIQKQPMMRRVFYAMSPLILFSLYLYGWRALTIMVVSLIFGYLSEYIMERILKGKKDVKVTEAFMVTSFLYALSMPPSAGELSNLWIVAVGIVFGIVFGKMAYGGFGRNVFNPAIAGRLFVFLTFPGVMTGTWLLGGNFGVDVQAGVTPLVPLKLDSNDLSVISVGLHNLSLAWNMFLGTRAGSLGESSILLIILGGAYLIFTNTAQRRLMFSPIISAFLFMAIFYYVPDMLGLPAIQNAVNPFYGMMAGSLLFASVFMITEPVTAPNKPWAQIAYGALIGLLIVLIRTFSALPESVSFAIILGNIFASLLDEMFGKPNLKSKVPDWTVRILLLICFVMYFFTYNVDSSSSREIKPQEGIESSFAIQQEEIQAQEKLEMTNEVQEALNELGNIEGEKDEEGKPVLVNEIATYQYAQEN